MAPDSIERCLGGETSMQERETMEREHEKYERLIARCKSLPPARTAVAHPCDESSLRRMPYDEVAGIVAGACGNPAILAYANKLTPTDRPDIGYAMILPGMTIVKILFVDIVPALL